MSLNAERHKRIITTHVGSLPRPDALTKIMAADDFAAESPASAAAIRDAVAEIVRKQAEVGVDMIDDGEQSKPGFVVYVMDRLSGVEPRTDDIGPHLTTRETLSFPEVYAHGHAGYASHSGTLPPRFACTGPIRYTGHARLRTDIENLKAVVKSAHPLDVFMPSASPTSIQSWQVNRHYKSDEEWLFAIAEAMREEYEAIVEAGFMVQIDDPRLAMFYMLNPGKDVKECRHWAEGRVEALNYALRNIPSARVRHHTCHGINMGPRVNDMEMKNIVDIVLKIKADYYSFEAANPRHEHEWLVWEGTKLAEGKAIMPGVVTHTSVIVEHPELVAQRIARFAGLVGRENVIASVDCGFASTPRAVPEVHPTIVWEKLRSLTQGARLASRELWR